MSDANALGKGFWDDVTALVWQQLDPVLDYLASQMLEGEQVVGDVPITDPAERAAYYVHLAQNGTLDHLPVVSQRIFKSMDNQFARDAAQTLGLQ